jgi:hypothetical protein
MASYTTSVHDGATTIAIAVMFSSSMGTSNIKMGARDVVKGTTSVVDEERRCWAMSKR